MTSRLRPRALSIVLATAVPCVAGTALAAPPDGLEEELVRLIEENAPDGKLEDFRLPDGSDLSEIPQDLENNPLTEAKIELGRLLFHETAVGTATPSEERRETYGCASCHHAAAGFKSGRKQGIADGGSGFGERGEGRHVAAGTDPDADDGDPAKPDFQPVASPTTLNVAYHGPMLWNGELDSHPDGVNVENVDPDVLEQAGPAGRRVNEFGLSGIATQVLAAIFVHRLEFARGPDHPDSILNDPEYVKLYDAAFPDGDTGYIPAGSSVTPVELGAAKAIAAYERTLLADRAPFQRWLRGERDAMGRRELAGAVLFFGKAGCVGCHTGPALSSWPDADEDELFQAVGFADLDTGDRRVHGTVPEAASHGRGGFTGKISDRYKFKVASLYNAADARVLGHGASFESVAEVIEYKNAGVPQNGNVTDLDPRFVPLGLDSREVKDLTAFVERALRDPALDRYVPDALPSGNCFPVADVEAALDLGCY